MKKTRRLHPRPGPTALGGGGPGNLIQVAHASRVVLIITGSIAACSMPHFLLFLRSVGFESIRVIMTRSALEFVTARTIALMSRREVLIDPPVLADHATESTLSAKQGDLIVVMPSTANTIAKAAHGLFDDLASSTIASAQPPVLFVPAMNERMWVNPITQRNVERLIADGHVVLKPAPGLQISDMSEGASGMPAFHQVAVEMVRILAKNSGRPKKLPAKG